MLSRKNKLVLNTFAGLCNQCITIACGFVLPRFLLQTYGSEVNGLLSSITQFLSFIALMELGIGAVVQSVLYKPLADKDNEQISKILRSAEQFFRRIAFFFMIYVACLSIVYPFIVENSFTWWFDATLILIMAISSFAQYYFGITYQLLLNADQKAFITLGLQSSTLLINTIISVLLMINGASIQSVKLFSAIILLARPLLQNYYVKRHYHINNHVELNGEEPIKQKWNGIAQHISSFVLGNTDVVILTLFSTLTNVSIYTIYNLVVTGVKQMIMAFTTGTQALLGNMLARQEYSLLEKRFLQYEWIMHTLITLCFTCTGLLIVPFVNVYTNGISDANYIVPIFGYLLTLAIAAYCLRLPYNVLVLAAGHYRQTQASAIIEMCINLVISIILVFNFGLVGVAIGTLVAMSYRTIYLASYIRSIINYKLRFFVKHLLVDILSAGIIIFLAKGVVLESVEYLSWFLMAIKTFGISTIVVIIMNFIFYGQQLLNTLKRKMDIS